MWNGLYRTDWQGPEHGKKEHCIQIKPNNPKPDTLHIKKKKNNGPTLTSSKLIKAKKSKAFDLRIMLKYQISR